MEFLQSYYNKLFNGTEINLESDQTINYDFPELIGFGNVLLDMSIEINDTKILDKYGLSLDCQGELKSEVLSEILLEIEQNTQINNHPGGSTLNTVRILNKLNNKNVKFFGAIGEDETGKILQDILLENGINTSFQIIPSVSSGLCLCFIHGDKCALYANIGASKYFTTEFLQESENEFITTSTNKLQIFYIEGFFIPGREKICKFVVNEYIGGNKLLAINLNGSYIIKENIDIVKYLFNHSTLIFGNRAQYITLVEEFGYKSIEDLAQHLFTNENRKILIITDGNEDVELYSNYESENLEINYIPVPKINIENIVDTTGAGDSFVAGFLELFLKRQPLEMCIINGCSIAGKVITQIGCNLP